MIDENLKEELIKNLSKLGLTKNESSVYLALLMLGEVGSSKILSHTNLHGQYVYQSLESLEKKGLVQHVIKRGRKKFSAKNPSQITKLIDQQKKLADDVVSQLQKAIVLPPAQQFEIFQGNESYISHELNLLDSAQENSELLVIGGEGDNFGEIMKNELFNYEKVRNKKNIKIRYIGSEVQRDSLDKSKAERRLFEYRLLPGLFTGLVNTNIWSDKISFNLFGEPVTAFLIQNQQIADSYRQFFDTLWKLAK
jgi:sugar-specific transcriptional regulator TrmB